MENNASLATLFTLTQTATLFATLMPPMHELQEKSPGESRSRVVPLWTAIGTSVAVGAVAAGVTQSAAPLYAAGIMCLALSFVYEAAARYGN